MYKILFRPLILTSVFSILVTAVAAAPLVDTEVNSPATVLKWIDCPTKYTPSLRCANFSVPVDWSQRTGAQTLLGLNMVPAKNQSKKIGSLFFNSGGPGGEATPELSGTPGGSGLFWFTDEIFDKFDVVAMDPRGIGASSPMQCSPEIYNKRVSFFPQTETTFGSVLEHFKELGTSCADLTGPLLEHVDSISVARDFDAVRAAMGDDKFSYIGLSYGTVIGTAYAELFPEKIRAMVLDGSVDHTQEQTYTGLTEIRTYEKVLTLFFDWCEHNSSCAMHPSHTNSTEPLADIWDTLIDHAERSPIPALGCKGVCHPDVTSEDILFNAQGMLLFTEPIAGFPLSQAVSWPALGLALYQTIFAHDATLLSTPLTLYQNDSSTYAFTAIFCQDWNRNLTSQSFPLILNLQQLARSVAPHTRGASEFWRALISCIPWPTPVAYPQRDTKITNAPPILLVNSYYDPETSYEWAVALQAEIAQSMLLTRNGAGHTSYGLRGETARAINEYLLTLRMPPPNTVYDT
jgi:pimeloyl-ACP methyl ester carboxylesterase